MHWGSAITDPGKKPDSLTFDQTNTSLKLVEIAIPFLHIYKAHTETKQNKKA